MQAPKCILNQSQMLPKVTLQDTAMATADVLKQQSCDGGACVKEHNPSLPSRLLWRLEKQIP